MSPYGFGMYAAYVHLSGINFMDSKYNRLIILEWLCFIIVLVNPFLNLMDPIYEGPNLAWLMIIQIVFQRSIYGSSLAFLMTVMLSVKPEENIPFYRPTKYLRAFLSWSLWVPFATLSFSFYLMHLQTILFFQ